MITFYIIAIVLFAVASAVLLTLLINQRNQNRTLNNELLAATDAITQAKAELNVQQQNMQQAIEKDMNRAVLPGFFLGTLQQIGTGQGLVCRPENVHNFHFTLGQFHLQTSLRSKVLVYYSGVCRFCQL